MAMTRRFVLLMMLVAMTAVGAQARKLVETLPATSVTLSGYSDTDSVRQRLQASGMHRIEGIWQFPSDGAKVVIERDHSSAGAAIRYNMVLLRSSRRSVPAGTVMGIIAPTSKADVYAASVYTSTLGASRLTGPRRYTLRLDERGRLSMSPDNKFKFSLNFWRYIPYLSNGLSLRGRTADRTPDDLDGCVRVFPTPVEGNVQPRYL